ncbi:MAG: alpha/beta fold hydrolase [Patescibacteria group bacterium]
MEKVRIPNSKGVNLSAVMHRPKFETSKLAILCPGYLDTKDYDHLVALAETLVGQGYTVVRFDPTGTWESEGDISEYTTTQYLSDVKSVLEYMLRKGNYKQILLGGHSRGGMVSVLYAARDPRISMVLGIMPSSPFSLDKKITEGWEKTGFAEATRDVPGKNETKKFQVPFSHAKDRMQYNSVEDAAKIHVPVIIVAGELDMVVLPEYAKMIFDRANEPKKFILIPGVGHDYRQNPSEIVQVNTKIIEAVSSL